MAECCSGSLRMIFSCSGAADLGELADRVARQLTKEKKGNMSCLASLATGSKGLVLSAEAAEVVLALDGCGLDCTKKCLEQAGVSTFRHVRLTDLGLKKGATPVTDETLHQVVEAVRPLLEGEAVRG